MATKANKQTLGKNQNRNCEMYVNKKDSLLLLKRQAGSCKLSVELLAYQGSVFPSCTKQGRRIYYTFREVTWILRTQTQAPSSDGVTLFYGQSNFPLKATLKAQECFTESHSPF